MQGIYDITQGRYRSFKIWWDMDNKAYATAYVLPETPPNETHIMGGYGCPIRDTDPTVFVSKINEALPYPIQLNMADTFNLEEDRDNDPNFDPETDSV